MKKLLSIIPAIFLALAGIAHASDYPARPALPNVGVQIVYLGPIPGQATEIELFVGALVERGYFASLAGDGFQRASYLGAVSWTPPGITASVPDALSRSATIAYLADRSGGVEPSVGPWGQTVYLLIPTGADSLIDSPHVCGYHADRLADGQTQQIVYAVAPPPSQRCNTGDTYFGTWTEIISHELLEAIARPLSAETSMDGYYAAWPELADNCGRQPPVWYGSWQVVTYEVNGFCTIGGYSGT